MNPEDYHSTDSRAEDLELYDSERVALSRVFAKLSDSIGKVRNLDGFAREAEERIAEVGFRAEVRLFEGTNPDGSKFIHPQITLLDRIETDPNGFDHDRMAHEVQTDVLGTGRGDVRGKTSVSMSSAQTKSGLWVPGGRS